MELIYEQILNSLSIAISIAEPILNVGGDIIDFQLIYKNKKFEETVKDILAQGQKYSLIKEKLSQDIEWKEIAIKVLNEKQSITKTFYSVLLNSWLKITIDPILENKLAVSLIDITKDKESEQQLRRQNLRLASLTDELSLSRANLKNKLENIQTLNEQLHFAAYHDSLTNLGNRAWFNRSISDAITSYNKTNERFGIILLDLDNVKDINDSQGHNAGDDFIRKSAQILRKFENEDTSAFRLEGDEFVILKRNIHIHANLITLGENILSSFNAQSMGFSGGITMYPDDAKNAPDLLIFADMAKAEAKKNGKNNICVFRKVMQENFLRKLNIESKLSKAMMEHVFQLYFQPQFDVDTGKLRGFEALIRWHDDDMGWISPEQFIPLAEESRLVLPIGEWVIDTALKTLAQWEKEMNFDGIMSINVSPLQFKTADFTDSLAAKLKEYGINTKHLEIEITEGMLIDNVEDIIAKLRKIRDLGVGVSLDDFGTGYSSLRYLQLLPLTTLKIDKSFIANISASDGIDANITESIVSLVSKLGLDTIAEGVETDSQLNMLKKFNCHNVQGFLKGKPMPASLCERMLKGDKSAILTMQDSTPESL